MGGTELVAKPWVTDSIPEGFCFWPLDEDWDQFEPLIVNALERVLVLGTAGTRKVTCWCA
jgi:4-methylaminobutanoate oxidase (formaldehyde-forming)